VREYAGESLRCVIEHGDYLRLLLAATAALTLSGWISIQCENIFLSPPHVVFSFLPKISIPSGPVPSALVQLEF
jgi:hypothetical protein